MESEAWDSTFFHLNNMHSAAFWFYVQKQPKSNNLFYWQLQIIEILIPTFTPNHIQAEQTQTCLMAVSPILSECLRMLSRKSLRSDMETSLMCVRRTGMFSAMMAQKRYCPAFGRQFCSNCSNVHSAG